MGSENGTGFSPLKRFTPFRCQPSQSPRREWRRVPEVEIPEEGVKVEPLVPFSITGQVGEEGEDAKGDGGVGRCN